MVAVRRIITGIADGGSDTLLAQQSPVMAATVAENKKGTEFTVPFLFATGGVDGTRTRDPRRDRPVF